MSNVSPNFSLPPEATTPFEIGNAAKKTFLETMTGACQVQMNAGSHDWYKLEHSPETRHLLTNIALMQAGIEVDAPEVKKVEPQADLINGLIPLADVAAYQITQEVKFAQTPDDFMFVSNAIDAFLKGTSEGEKPTYIYATPGTVDMIEDDDIGARYLERMLQGTALTDRWLPIIDAHPEVRRRLRTGELKNPDVEAMADWHIRFKNYPAVLHVVEGLLQDAGLYTPHR